eukprot:1239244-Rhodomonas_salina.3
MLVEGGWRGEEGRGGEWKGLGRATHLLSLGMQVGRRGGGEPVGEAAGEGGECKGTVDGAASGRGEASDSEAMLVEGEWRGEEGTEGRGVDSEEGARWWGGEGGPHLVPAPLCPCSSN